MTAPALDEAALSAATRAVWDNYGTGRAPTADELDSCRADADAAVTAYLAAQPVDEAEYDPNYTDDEDKPTPAIIEAARLHKELRERAIANNPALVAARETGCLQELDNALAAQPDRIAAPVDEHLGISPHMTGHTRECRSGDGWPCDCGYVIGSDRIAALEAVADKVGYVVLKTDGKYRDCPAGMWPLYWTELCEAHDALARLDGTQTEERK